MKRTLLLDAWGRLGSGFGLVVALLPVAALAGSPAGAPAPMPTTAPARPPAPPSPGAAPAPGAARAPRPPSPGVHEPPIPPSPFFDQCKTRGCHPQIASHSSASFGQGKNMTFTGQEFGNVKGKIRMTNAGVTVELPVIGWQNNQVIAGYQGVIGVLGGPSEVSIGTTDGSWSNPDDVVFDAIRVTIQVPAEPMHVESCTKGTSDNQCNGQHLGEGDLQQFAYKNPPAIVGHHYDNCNGPTCWKGGQGNDTYSLPPLKFGFRVVGAKARVTKCGYREKQDGTWANVGYTGDVRCFLEVKKVNIEDDRGTFQVGWGAKPEIDIDYAVDVTVEGPMGMIPW